ncbi:MAG: tetratricopeptide repeat protein [Ginsengibacter sp.]
MAKIFLLIFSSCSTLFCFSQQQEPDSLWNELLKHTREDTVRLNLLNQIAAVYSNISPEKGIEAAEQAIALAQRLPNIAMLALAYKNKGASYESRNSDSLALFYYNKALEVYQELHKEKEQAVLLYNMGLIYQKSNFYTALEYHRRALILFEKLNDTENIANCLRSIGVDHQYLSQYPKALQYLQKALHNFEQSENKKGVASVLADLGIVYTYVENFPKALEYHQKSLAIYEKAGNKKGMADELGNLGNVYDNMDDSIRALQSYQRALAISNKEGYKRSIASNLSNIGIVYNYYGDYSKAFDYLSRAVNFYEESGDKINASLTLDEIAKIYTNAPDVVLIKLGVTPQEKFIKAIRYQKRALALAHETGSVISQAMRWGSLSNTYEKQRDFAKSLDAYKRAIALRDSSLDNKKEEEITRLEIQFEFDKKEALTKAGNDKKHALALAEINKQKVIRNASIGISGILVLVAMAGIVLYKRRKDIVEKRKEAEFNVQVADTELKALRAQMNPHFIFNSLNSINDYIDKHDTERATIYTTKFAKLMRMILENSEQREIPIEDDLKALELYMQLESLRLQNTFTYEIKIDENIDRENTLIPPLILQPFVENSIWHGLSKKRDDGKIWIHIQKEGNMILCTVKDNGIGIHEVNTGAAQNASQKRSLGMKITRARIDIINKLKKSNGAVTMSDVEEGTKIEVRFPLELAF